MPDSQQASDTAWFDALPRDQPPQTQPEPQQQGQISVKVGSSPRPTSPQMIVKPSGGEPDTSWFDKLPRDTPPEMNWPQAERPPVPSTVSRGADLPTWAGGGAQPPPAQPPTSTQPATLGNVAGAIPSGLYEGVARIPNIPTDIVNAASGVMHGLTGQDYGHMQPPIDINPTGYQPQGKWAQGVHDAASAASNTAALGAVGGAFTPLLRASPATVAASAVGGAAEEPVARNVPEPYQPLARFGANVLAGGAAAGAESALGGAARSTISPETAQLAQLGRDTYDIPITAAQMSSNRMVKTADSVLKSVPFSGHGDLDHETQLAVNSAALRTFGENATKATPQVMQQARTRIGGVLQDVESRNPVNFDQQTVNDLAGIESNARSSLTDPEYGVIQRQLDGVMKNLQPGDRIAGNTYGNLMHKGSPLDAAANSKNPNVADYAGDIKDALRSSLQRSLSGDDAAAYQQARTQWKAMKTVEPATQSADVVGGASPSTGDINPTILRALVNKSYKDAAYRAPGEIPLNDIADIGQRFLKETPSSHTSERGWMLHLLTGMGGAALEGGGVPWHTMAAGAAGLGTGAIAGRIASGALQSDALANRMIRQGLAGPQPGVAESVAKASVPLMTSAGVRQLEPPEGPSTNPTTGLPQFSLEANQKEAERGVLGPIASQMVSGSLSDPKALKSYVDANKQAIRKALGGEAIHRVLMVGSLLRRPNTVFSVLSQTPSPAVQQAMAQAQVTDTESLLSLAMAQPKIAQLLVNQVSGSVLSKPLETRLISALKTTGGPNDADIRNLSGVDGGLRRSGTMGKNRMGNQPSVPPTVAPNAGASL